MIEFAPAFVMAFWCCVLPAQNCIFQSADGDPYSWKVTYRPQTGPAHGLPLKIVALGDSVVWGDGDKPEHKIVQLVSEKIANVTGRTVVLHSYAHSGARLFVFDPGSDPKFPVHHGKPLGNLDSERPTTSEQAECAAKADSEAEYVLLDGCINEIGAEHIALPPVLYPPNEAMTPADVRQEVLDSCSANMANTLLQIMREFRNAHVVVLDYFRVVSNASEPKPLETDAEKKQRETKNRQQERKLERVIKSEKNIGNLPGTGTPKQNAVQAWWANSDEFLKDTTSCFRWAIDAVNTGAVGPISNPQGVAYTASEPESNWPPVCPTFKQDAAAVGPPPLNPIVAAAFPDNPEYSYGASDTHLWLLPYPLFNPDELYWQRAWQCTLHLFRGDKDCYVNPIAHPKPNGARCYSESILAAIGIIAPKPDPDCLSVQTGVGFSKIP